MKDTLQLHCLTEPEPVLDIRGEAWHSNEEGVPSAPLRAGETLTPGQFVAVAAGSGVRTRSVEIAGGRRGRTHGFVSASAAQTTPSRRDVPRLLADMEKLEKRILDQFGQDPLEAQGGPEQPFDRAVAADFAFNNLTLEVALELPERVARDAGAVCLFLSGDAACIALAEVSVRKIRILMETLQRPISPHVVDPQTLRTLLTSVYGSRALG
jgi:hypothetical protein